MWVGSTLTAGRLSRPRATRTATGARGLAGADALQPSYGALVVARAAGGRAGSGAGADERPEDD
ncbi:hypothetical protein [Streptomyces sp. NPDC021608]|uniref:hypothetical protein n=1 Tax=Streptomyces sp. NPDC021608 TaxID=3154903 RepID=UPI0033E0C986